MINQLFKEIDHLQKEINALRPFNEQEIKQIKEYYKIGLTYTSNALEGNSLTETETKIVIEEGLTIGGKPLKDHLEVVGHADAYDLLLNLSQNKEITEDSIKELHRLFYLRIDERNAGVYRKVKAYITGSKYPLPVPKDISRLMGELIPRIQSIRGKKHPVEIASLVHKEFVFIHPFVDGNGRVARLLMNLVLLQEGYNIALIPFVCRNQYIESLEKAHTNDSDFIDLVARMVRETQKDYLRIFC